MLSPETETRQMQTQGQTANYSLNGPLLQYLLTFLFALVLYTATCAPTVLWQDSGLFVYRILHNDLQGNLGIALAHPLYIIIGIVARLIPFGELAWRINMISAVFAAAAVANLFLLLRLWLGKVWPAIIGSVSLAVSWTFWQNAVVAEVYTLYAAQLFTELLVLFQYVRTKRTGYLYLLGFLNGLAIANHLWGVFPLACYGVYLLLLLARKQVNLKSFLLFIIFWIVGASPYEYLVVKNVFSTGEVLTTVKSAVFGSDWENRVLNLNISVRLVIENMVFIVLNFPTPSFLLFIPGVLVLYRKSPSRAFANISLAMTLLFFIFAFRYTVADRHEFFLPFYCMAAVFIALGADWLLTRYGGRKLVFLILAFFLFCLALLPVGSYFVTPEIARKYYKPLGERRQRPYRDEYTYWLVPWKCGYNGAERFATEALEGVEKNAVVYAYTTDVHSMLYVQEVKGIRPDVRIVSDHDHSANAPTLSEGSVADILAAGPLYVTSARRGYYPSFLNDNYQFVRHGLLYRVVESGRNL
jgi:hypothetical protein